MKTMSKLVVEKSSELKEIYDLWKSNTIGTFEMSRYEEIFSLIYSFYTIVEAIEREIEKKLNDDAKRTQSVLVNGTELQIKLTTDSVPIRYRELTKQWNTLNDIHFSELEKEKLGLKFEDCLRLRYANYKGFIDRICMMIDKNVIYY